MSFTFDLAPSVETSAPPQDQQTFADFVESPASTDSRSFVDLVEGVGPAESRRGLTWSLFAIFAVVWLASAARLMGWRPESLRSTLVDFHDFYLAGLLVHTGEIARAYRLGDLLQLQKAVFHDSGMLPWTYPPPFDLVVAALALLPIGVAYLVFASSTLAAYILALRRLAPDRWLSVLLLLAPALIITLRCGQNGFLTGALMATAAMGLSAGSAWAGLPLGLMLIKPHLAVTFALYVLLTRRWNAIGVAALVVVGACLAATLVLGPAIWAAFFVGVQEAGGFLGGGLYPSYRMVSVYAMARSFHFSADVGAACQFVFAGLALGATAIAALRLPPRPALGVAALAALMVSPYAYDYDLPIFGVGLALVWPDLRRFLEPRWRTAFCGLALATQCLALALSAINDIRAQDLVFMPSLGAVSLLAGLSLAGVAYRRARRDARPAVA